MHDTHDREKKFILRIMHISSIKFLRARDDFAKRPARGCRSILGIKDCPLRALPMRSLKASDYFGQVLFESL